MKEHSQGDESERRYSVPPSTLSEPATLHAWSIYRQNLNSDFTDSALDMEHKSQPPFGDFRLGNATAHSILNHPKYGARGGRLADSAASYLRFGLPRVPPPLMRRARSEPDLLLFPTQHTKGEIEIVNGFFPTQDEEEGEERALLQVRDLLCEEDVSSTWRTLCGGRRTKRRLLDSISFEAHSGEMLLVIPTDWVEGTALLDSLCDRSGHRRIRGELLLNGRRVSPAELSARVGYVQRHAPSAPDMSVRQAMLFESLLRWPPQGTHKARVDALLEDLGLSAVRHTRVRDLSESEWRRLSLALQLMLDTDILLLDDPTKDMDIFDSFFLVEYLRQWAARGRLVILTMQPPTYEVFAMMSSVAIISSGRLLYFGKRRDLLSYFSYLDFPCPAFKNPSDYYLDLVTLDNLSAEALLESSQRVDSLAEIFRRRRRPLSPPGIPAPLLPCIRRAGLCGQATALFVRALIYGFPFNVIRVCCEASVAASSSLIVGAAFWFARGDLTASFAFHRALLSLAPWPLLLLAAHNEWKEKMAVDRDIKEKIYYRFTYIICKLIWGLVPSAVISVAFAAPAHAMLGLSPPFGAQVATIAVYMLAFRMLTVAAAATARSLAVAIALTAAPLAAAALLGEFSALSPVLAANQLLVAADSNARPSCSGAPVLEQEGGILMRAECGLPTRQDTLDFHGLNSADPTPALLVVLAALLLLLVSACANRCC